MVRVSEATAPRGGRRWAVMWAFIFCGVAQIGAARGPRDFGDRATNADRSGSTPLTGANSYPRRRNFGAGPPKAGCECSTHSVGANHAVEAHRDVQRIGSAQAAGANPAIGTRHALQALTAERRIRKPEVDRAIRSWGTSHGSLTQRDRDPPCNLVSGRREVQVLSRAPITESEAGGVLHAVANRWVPSLRHGLRVVRSPPIRVVLWEETGLQNR